MKSALSFRVTRWIGVVVLLIASTLSGCATPPTDPAERAVFVHNNDPLEPLNRKTFELNQFLDKVIFKPAAKTYVAVIPADGRTAIHHMLDNMKEPTLFFNNVLQGEFKRAEITLGRFIVNSTVGFGGMVDVMKYNGVERQPADFGQTLYVWGFSSGPYLILPILGPTNPRDAIGAAVDSYADPTMILVNENDVTEVTTWRFVVGGIDERANVLDELDDLEKNSVDFYAQLRSLTQQHREAQLNHGKAPEATPDLYNDPGQPPAQPTSPAPSPAKPSAVKAPAKTSKASIATRPLAPRKAHTASKSPQGSRINRCATTRCAGRAA